MIVFDINIQLQLLISNKLQRCTFFSVKNLLTLRYPIRLYTRVSIFHHTKTNFLKMVLIKPTNIKFMYHNIDYI